MTGSSRTALAALVTLGLGTVSGVAHAVDTEVTSDTAAQFYDVRSPSGDTVLARRRLTTSLGVSAYDLLPRDKVADPMSAEINFKARLRYDADYGASPEETNPANTARVIPGFDRGPVDLMYAYIEGRHFLHHTVDFKIGRQYVTDALGWWSFDGAEIKATTPYYVAVEAYGGLEERGGMPLSTGRFEADGAWRGDRTGFNTALAPSFQQSSNAPAFGAALETAGITWLHSRLSYRRVYNTGESVTSLYTNGLTSPVSYDGTRVSSDQVGYSLEADAANLGAFKGGFAYDLYNVKMSNMYASIDAFATKKLIVSLDYDYVSPTFDADSIFNFFDIQPMNDFGVRADLDATDRLSFAGGAHARAFSTETSPQTGTGTTTAPQSPNVSTGSSTLGYFPSSQLNFDGGGNFAVRYKTGTGVYGLRSNGSFGSDGDRVGGDLYGERSIETRFLVSGRTSLYQWDDKLRPDRDATSFGYTAGVGYRFLPRDKIMFEWEHNINRLVGQRFRAMIMLTLAVMP